MLFNSWEFLTLLLGTVFLYHLPFPARTAKVWQVTLLLVASAVFYSWENPRLLLLLGTSCLVNAIAVERILFWKNRIQCFGVSAAATPSSGSTIEENNSCCPSETPMYRSARCKARQWLIWTVALNLALLAFFKYAGFLTAQIPPGWLSTGVAEWLSGIPLPVGISFYTFQGISLVVDVWRGDISKSTSDRLAGRGRSRIESIRDTSFYISFFPQLVAGPIVKAHEFVDQIGVKRFTDIDWTLVRRSLILGYFLKIFVADNLAEQTASLTLGADRISGSGPLNLIPLLYGYSFQIFADFAGYSLIAIGLGALFGYKLPPNFNFPYLSISITEFWRRWHLSLSSWLRDYLYFPLGGNRKGAGRTYFNLFLVMFLGGLWHGAAWKFALWGSLHGLFLGFERFSSSTKLWVSDSRFRIRSFSAGLDANLAPPSTHQSRSWTLSITFIKWIFTFHLVTALWLTFMMPDLASIAAFFKEIAVWNPKFSGPPIFSLLFYGSAIVLYHAWGWLREHRQHYFNKLSQSPLEPVIHGLMLFLILTNPGAPRGFIYFQF